MDACAKKHHFNNTNHQPNSPGWDKNPGFEEEFSCQLLKIVESRLEYIIKKDQGWYSEKEMRDDLKWPTY